MTTKKSIFTITGAILLGVVALAGCTKSEQGASSGDLAIHLEAGIKASTKAVVATGSTFTAAVAGWESATGGADYSHPKAWLASSSITSSATAIPITLTPQPYYSQNGAVTTYIRAWYPAGTLSDDGTVAFGGSPDGSVDVLFSDEVSGSALAPVTRGLVLSHPLTQLRFTVQGDALFGATTTVRSIVIKEAGLPSGIDLKTGSVQYAAPREVLVPGIDGSQSITTTVSSVGNIIMLQPFTGNSFKVDVTTSDVTYRDVVATIDADQSFVPGKAYTIALTFSGYAIGAAASVTPWDESGTGSGDVTTD